MGVNILRVLNNIFLELKNQNRKQKELTDYLGISKNVFTDWKSGKNKSYMKYLPQIAEFLGVSVDYLLSDNPEQIKKAPDAKAPEADETFNKMWSMYFSLSDKGKAAAEKYLEFLLNTQNNE